MRLETLKNECFIIDCFFLYYFSEIFIDLIIIHNPQCSHLSRLSFSLHEIWLTSSSWGSVLTLSSLRSISELNSLLSFLSWLSIIQNIINSFFHKGPFIKARIISVIDLFFSGIIDVKWVVKNRLSLMILKFSFESIGERWERIYKK